MRFFRWFFYFVIAAALAWFAATNWSMVTINLVPPTQLVMPLPLLVLICLALGALPPTFSHMIDRWRWKRRVKRAEQLAEQRALELAEIKGERERMMLPEEAEAALKARVAAAGAAYVDDEPVTKRSAPMPPGV
ncbi:hypothetical protein [Pedomonas mirosovicensis]|uniref:hypothetical protein n=1 Tax=Pedomonas mirosovicensis TaxID=2908641 RepID=UPI0021680EC3|nr:hypothetical protein [Pedomonas mirosovicensis]MCH8684186.1 hypothetical protein [Pedomonas mirosovicensis]